jgi:phage-related protein
MAHSLSVVNIIDKNKLASNSPWLLLLDIDVLDTLGGFVSTLRVVRNTDEITYQGNVYAPAAFELNLSQKANEQTSLTLTFQDQTRAIQAYMQEYGGGIGFRVTMTIVNADNLSQPPEIREYMQVIGASAENYVVTFTLGAENALSRVFPRRMQYRDFCTWKYKGTECGYSGGLATCDRTLQGPNGCAAHNNVANFGGFPGLNGSGRRYV